MGAPIGNQNGAKGFRWQAAVERALERRSRAKGQEELDRLADVFLDKVITAKGVDGFRELADRLDGKSVQPIKAEVDGTLSIVVKQFTLPGGS